MDHIKHLGMLTIVVVELEDTPDDKRAARYACQVLNRNTGQMIGTVLTNGTFEGINICMTDDDNLQEILDCATRTHVLNGDLGNVISVNLFNFGPVFPGTSGAAARKLI